MGYVLRVERKPLNKKVYNSAFRVCRCSQFLSFACPSQFFFFFFLRCFKTFRQSHYLWRHFIMNCLCLWRALLVYPISIDDASSCACCSRGTYLWLALLSKMFEKEIRKVFFFVGQLIKAFALCARKIIKEKGLWNCPKPFQELNHSRRSPKRTVKGQSVLYRQFTFINVRRL